MNKKILYGIFFVSIFLLSTATMVTPVQGYTFGVPKEAVGMKTKGEVKIFDEDEVDDHLGSGVDLEGLHGGDCDVVGAQSQTHYMGIKRDEEINYLDEYVADPADIPASHDMVHALLLSLADINGTYGGLYPAGSAYGPYGSLVWLANYSTYVVSQIVALGPLAGIAAAAQAEANQAQIACALAIDTYANVIDQFSKKYDGVILDRETWDFQKDLAKLDEKPDDKDNPAPFFADPADWNDVAEHLQAYQYYIGSGIDSIQAHWADLNPSSPGWYATLAGGCIKYFYPPYSQGALALLPYQYVNDTIYNQLLAISDPVLRGTLLYLMAQPNDLGALITGSSLPGTNGTYSEDYVLGLFGFVDVVLETVYAQFHASIPDKAGFFLGQLIAGQPAMVPQADFMAKVVKEYNLKDDVLYDMYGFQYGEDLDKDGEISAVPVGAESRFTGTPLGGETVYPKAYMDFSAEGGVVTVKIEWPKNMIDPADMYIFGGDNEDELKDFEIVFPYGDTGGQGTVSYQHGTTIFWQMGGVEQIPGFEISIILGASALSIIGLIYVIMKKRKM
jgi:hypothetical protein